MVRDRENERSRSSDEDHLSSGNGVEYDENAQQQDAAADNSDRNEFDQEVPPATNHTPNSKEAKAEKRRLRLLADEHERSPYRSRPLSRSRSPPSRYRSPSRSPRRKEPRRRSASPRSHSYADDRRYPRRTSPSTYERDRPRNYRRGHSRSPPPSDRRLSTPSSAKSHVGTSQSIEDDRAARLADMTASAGALEVDRRRRLENMLQIEKEELEREDRERARLAKNGVGGFLEGERRRVYAGGLEGGLAERIRRGRATLVGVD